MVMMKDKTMSHFHMKIMARKELSLISHSILILVYSFRMTSYPTRS